jgi:hypothetical protein
MYVLKHARVELLQLHADAKDRIEIVALSSCNHAGRIAEFQSNTAQFNQINNIY